MIEQKANTSPPGCFVKSSWRITLQPSDKQKGFSLVELSIVLVVLGLLVGGVLTGQNLIRAAELRSVTTEFQTFQTAAMTFKDKYFALPGDMPNATDFWGAATCPTAAGTGTETCNGNGDGQINAAANPDEFGEMFTVWQHQANAGLLEGSFTGIAGSDNADGTDTEINENTPSSRLGNAGWTIYYQDLASVGGTASRYEIDYGNALFFGNDFATGFTLDQALTPEEAWNIDTKIDDGLPARGKVIAVYWNDACAAADDGGSADDDFDASYRLSDTSLQCALIFKDAF